MSVKEIRKKMAKFGVRVSDKVSAFVGTWSFIFIYTGSMITWIILHLMGVLHIDGPDFIKWNLWLSYFAGTQASLVLMSQARQSDNDRKRQELDLHIGKKTLQMFEINNKRMESMVHQMDVLEDILDAMIEESAKNER